MNQTSTRVIVRARGAAPVKGLLLPAAPGAETGLGSKWEGPDLDAAKNPMRRVWTNPSLAGNSFRLLLPAVQAARLKQGGLAGLEIQADSSNCGLRVLGARAGRTETVDHNETRTIHASGIIAIPMGL